MKHRFILSSFFGLLAWVFFTSSTGGYGTNTTGARGNYGGCNCHGSTTTINPILELDSAGVAVTSYVPGMAYTVKLSGTSSTARPYFGFELSLVKATGAGSTSAVQAGTWGTMPSGARSVTSATKIMVEQNTQIAASGGMYSISIPWTAPTAGTGSVRIYGLLNGVNNDGNTSGDGAQASTNNGLTITEAIPATVSGISNIGTNLGVKLYPIPNNGSFVIASENMHGADVVITDLYGNKVGSRKISSDRENISDLSLSPSIYLVSITHDGKTQTIKMLVTRD
jgi:Secretion system C-terminal sorting domain